MVDPAQSSEAAPLSQPSFPARQALGAGASPEPRPPERVTLDALVSVWIDGVRRQTARTLWRGELAHRYLVGELASVVGPGKRRKRRAALVAELTARLAKQGIQESASHVDQIIGCWQVAQLLGTPGEDAKELSIRVLRAFLPLIRRDPATEEWFLQPEYADAARRLWKRITSGRFGQSTRGRHDGSPLPSEEQKT